MPQRPLGKNPDQGQNPDIFRTILALWSAIPDLSGHTVHVTSLDKPARLRFCIQYLSNSTKITTNTETAMMSTLHQFLDST